MAKRKPYKTMLALYTKAYEREKATCAALYAFAPDGNTHFSECLELATPEAREAYHVACRYLLAAERTAVDAGTAYWAQPFGILTFYPETYR